MENYCEDEKPPPVSDSEGSRSVEWYGGIDTRYLYRISIRSGGNIQSLAIHGLISMDSLHKHKVVDLGLGGNE